MKSILLILTIVFSVPCVAHDKLDEKVIDLCTLKGESATGKFNLYFSYTLQHGGYFLNSNCFQYLESANSNEWLYKEFGAKKNGRRKEGDRLQIELIGRAIKVKYDEKRGAYVYKIYLDKLLGYRSIPDKEWDEIELERQKHKKMLRH